MAVNPYGDGEASARVVAAIAELVGIDERLSEFDPNAAFTESELAMLME